MGKIIDADAVKLAGLQIDMLQKYRDGQRTLDHIEWFNKRTKEELDAFLTGNITFKEKFALFADLGEITVPAKYVHEKQLDSFYKKNHGQFYSYNKNITDEHFAKATVKLEPGRKLKVRVFK